MATRVTHDIEAAVDHLLDTLQRNWIDAVVLIDQWDAIDDIEQTDLIVEWPLTVDRLTQVLQYAERGQLTASQRERLEELRSFMREHEHQLIPLLGASAPTIVLPRS